MPTAKKSKSFTFPKTVYVNEGEYSNLVVASKVGGLFGDYDLESTEGKTVAVYELKGTKKVTIGLAD